MALGTDLGEYFLYGAVGCDDDGGADDAHVRLAVHGFFAPGAPGFQDSMVGVGEEGERQAVLGAEFAVRAGLVRADAYDDGAPGQEEVVGVAETAGFLGAAGGVVLGVEIHDDGLAAKRRQGYGLAGVVLEAEIGCRGSFSQHGGLLAYIEKIVRLVDSIGT